MTAKTYAKRIYKKMLLETFDRLTHEVLGDDDANPVGFNNMRSTMTRMFITEELNLADPMVSIADIQARLRATGNRFIIECGDTAEEVADSYETCCKEDPEIDAEIEELGPDYEPELSNEDKHVVDLLFDVKAPEKELSDIRDSMVAALDKERENNEEIEKATDLIKQDAEATGKDPEEAVQEAAMRMYDQQPVSLMEALLNVASRNVITNEAADHKLDPASAMEQNADLIRNQACVMYTLYEMVNRFGLHRYSPEDVKSLARRIFSEKPV